MKIDFFIVKKIKELKRVQPDSSWLSSQKSFLLSEISRMQEQKRKPSLVLPLFNFNILKLLKPSFAIALMVVILISSVITVGAIGVAQNSLPGDFLYPVKTAFEKTQLTFATSQETKTKLSIKFATQRMDEFTQLMDKPEKKKDIENTVKEFTAQMINVQEGIDKLKEKNEEKATEVAELIKNQTSAYEETLINSTEKLGYILPEDKEGIREDINQALTEIGKVSQISEELTEKSDVVEPSEGPGEEILVPAENVEEVIESESFENLQEEVLSEEAQEE